MKISGNGKLILGFAGAVIVLSWFRKPTTATVTTSEGFDLSVYGGPTTYPQPIKNVAVAIARAEGFFVPNSVPARANNPGDLKVSGKPVLPGTSITKFDSADAGWTALYNQLYLILTGRSGVYNLDMSIADMGRLWTATATEQGAWSSNVAQSLGVDPATPLWSVLA